jgi:hypothetical protein
MARRHCSCGIVNLEQRKARFMNTCFRALHFRNRIKPRCFEMRRTAYRRGAGTVGSVTDASLVLASVLVGRSGWESRHWAISNSFATVV